jgi:hypothetical protein
VRVGIHEDFRGRESIRPSSDRAVGFVISLLLGSFAFWPLLTGGSIRWKTLAVSGTFAAAALIFPAILHPLNLLWIRLGLLLAKVTNPIVTGALFYVVFTPAAVLLRLLGKDLLCLKHQPEANSYWVHRRPPGPPPETMRNQF